MVSARKIEVVIVPKVSSFTPAFAHAKNSKPGTHTQLRINVPACTVTIGSKSCCEVRLSCYCLTRVGFYSAWKPRSKPKSTNSFMSCSKLCSGAL